MNDRWREKAKAVAIIALLFITLFFLGRYIFQQAGDGTNKDSFLKTSTGLYQVVAEVPLGQVEVYNYQRMGFTKGFVCFSPDGAALAVGTENSELLVLESEMGKLKWRKRSGNGKISALAFSRDGRRLYVGENGPQADLICLDAQTGEELWRRGSAKELGSGLNDKTYPGIVCIRESDAGTVYAAGQRTIRSAERYEYRGRLYAYTPEGALAGKFPQERNLDAWVGWMSVSAQGQVFFGTANWDAKLQCQDNQSIYKLDEGLRQVLWSTSMAPVPPYERTTLRSSPEVTEDGKWVVSFASDGRAFLHHGEDGTLVWRRTLSRPELVNGIYVNATGLYGQATADRLVFTTGNTYNRANWQMTTPMEHPSSNCVFLFDYQGRLIEKKELGGMAEQLALSEGAAAVAVGRNSRTKNAAVHGLTLLSLRDGSVLDRLALEGPCAGAAISKNGRFAAAVEAPLQLDDGTIMGEYRLIVIKKPAQ